MVAFVQLRDLGQLRPIGMTELGGKTAVCQRLHVHASHLVQFVYLAPKKSVQQNLIVTSHDSFA